VSESVLVSLDFQFWSVEAFSVICKCLCCSFLYSVIVTVRSLSESFLLCFVVVVIACCVWYVCLCVTVQHPSSFGASRCFVRRSPSLLNVDWCIIQIIWFNRSFVHRFDFACHVAVSDASVLILLSRSLLLIGSVVMLCFALWYIV